MLVTHNLNNGLTIVKNWLFGIYTLHARVCRRFLDKLAKQLYYRWTLSRDTTKLFFSSKLLFFVMLPYTFNEILCMTG